MVFITIFPFRYRNVLGLFVQIFRIIHLDHSNILNQVENFWYSYITSLGPKTKCDCLLVLHLESIVPLCSQNQFMAIRCGLNNPQMAYLLLNMWTMNYMSTKLVNHFILQHTGTVHRRHMTFRSWPL